MGLVASMTGYGRAEVPGARLAVSVEIRSLNHRFLEIGVKLPRSLAAPELGDAAAWYRVAWRGVGVDVSIVTPLARGEPERGADRPALAEGYVREARGLAARFGIDGAVGRATSPLAGVVSVEEAEEDDSLVGLSLKDALAAGAGRAGAACARRRGPPWPPRCAATSRRSRPGRPGSAICLPAALARMPRAGASADQGLLAGGGGRARTPGPGGGDVAARSDVAGGAGPARRARRAVPRPARQRRRGGAPARLRASRRCTARSTPLPRRPTIGRWSSAVLEARTPSSGCASRSRTWNEGAVKRRSLPR